MINNRASRIETMKSIILRLHDGADPETVRSELTKLVRETDASEIAAMEQELIHDGMPAEKIKSMCDLHADVLRDITANPEEERVSPGHPVDTFRLENFALRNAVEKFRMQAAVIAAPGSDDIINEIQRDLVETATKLMDIDKHYSRKENLLFPYLEKYGITGPSQVMWAKDDEVRELIKELVRKLKSAPTSFNVICNVIESDGARAVQAVEEMIYKEENILLPMALQTLTAEEWGEIFRQSPEIGWCLVEPRSGYHPPVSAAAPKVVEIPENEAVHFSTGSLTYEQLQAVFAALPVDLTFVDADDQVRYFSHKPDSIFARNEAILGRKVQNCHPPKSVHIVEQILADFRQGKQDVAEFWIQFHGKFVHIRYFALRDDKGEYLGTLEVTQDVTEIKALEGERRLLQWYQA